ncbi:hypothetical protein D9M68_864080 [compost metagenome]
MLLGLPEPPSGTDKMTEVPRPEELMSSQPFTFSARSLSPSRPNDLALRRASALMPQPLSLTSSVSTPSRSLRSMSTALAWACLATLVSASCAVR